MGVFNHCRQLIEVNLSSYPVYTLKIGCFEDCVSLRTVILPKRTKKIMASCFAECISLKNIGYECELESTENPDTRCGLDLEHICDIGSIAFADCTSLESIKLYNHRIIYDTFYECGNLKRISLPGDMHFKFDLSCAYFVSEKVEQLIVRPNIDIITYTVAYYEMYKIISRNRNLFEKYCTPDNLYPLEVAVSVLYLSPSNIKKSDDDLIIKVLYHYLREVPWILEKYLNEVSQ